MQTFKALFEEYLYGIISEENRKQLMSMIVSGNFDEEIKDRIEQEIAMAINTDPEPATTGVLETFKNLFEWPKTNTCRKVELTKTLRPRKRLAQPISPTKLKIMKANKGKVLQVKNTNTGKLCTVRESFFDNDKLHSPIANQYGQAASEEILRNLLANENKSFYFSNDVNASAYIRITNQQDALSVTPLSDTNLTSLSLLIENRHGVHVFISGNLNEEEDAFLFNHNASFIELLKSLSEKYAVICSPSGDAIQLKNRALQTQSY